MLLDSLITSYFKDIIDDNFPGTLELSVTETLIILSSKFGISIKVAPAIRGEGERAIPELIIKYCHSLKLTKAADFCEFRIYVQCKKNLLLP